MTNTNARKYNARKYELIRKSEELLKKAYNFKAVCADCGTETQTRLRVQDCGAYNEQETIAEFCESECFNSWCDKPYIKPKVRRVRGLV